MGTLCCCSYKLMARTNNNSHCTSSSLAYRSNSGPPLLHKFLPCPQPLSSRRSRGRRGLAVVVLAQSSELSNSKDEWLKKLPDKKKPLYAHSLPCIEAWLYSLGFYQNKHDRALWFVEKPDWHAQLSLDLTDLYIRFHFHPSFFLLLLLIVHSFFKIKTLIMTYS